MKNKIIDGGFISSEESYLFLRGGKVLPISPTSSMDDEVDDVYAARLVVAAPGRWAAAARVLDEYEKTGIDDGLDPLFIVEHFAPLPMTGRLLDKFSEVTGDEWTFVEASFVPAIWALAAASGEPVIRLPEAAAPLVQAQVAAWRVSWREAALRVASLSASLREPAPYDRATAQDFLARFMMTYVRIQYGCAPSRRDWAMLLNDRLRQAGMVTSTITFNQIKSFLEEDAQ